jgi:hypothetical protein
MYVFYTHHSKELYSKQQLYELLIFYNLYFISIFYYSNMNLSKNYVIFNCGVTSTCYNCRYYRSLLPEVTTQVAATSQWLLCDKTTLINPSPLVGLLINFMHSVICITCSNPPFKHITVQNTKTISSNMIM